MSGAFSASALRGKMAGEPRHGVKWMAEHVAARAAIERVAVDGHFAFDCRQIRPVRHELAEDDACIPGIVGDHRQYVQGAIIGTTIVDDFDGRTYGVDGGRDLGQRRRALRRQIALEPHGDLELEP